MEASIIFRGELQKTYLNICEKLEPARKVYTLIAESYLGLNPRKELEAAEIAAINANLIAINKFLHWLSSRKVNSGVACIFGPLPVEDDPRCEIRLGVEQSMRTGLKMNIVTGDLDSLNFLPMNPSISDFYLIHLHGDNLNIFYNLNINSEDNIVFTNQKYCLWPILGIGGFTDGDRLVALAMAIGFKKIILKGFNFENPYCTGKPSCDPNVKKIKLKIAKIIIGKLMNYYNYHFEEGRGKIILTKTV